jgi:tetratricopeptide (TPR) repeat protein
MLDVQIFGLDAGAHHLESAVIHAGSTLLLFALLRSLTGAFWKSLLAAAVFGVHPLRVESVAWAAERKDVLATFFWFLTLAAWLGHVRRPGRLRHVAAIGAYCLALASKPTAMTLPAVLLLLDWWPLGRLARAGPRSRLREMAPFFVLAAASLAVTFVAQTSDARVFVAAGFPERAANAVVSAAVYLGKFLWPSGLAVLYPFPAAGTPAWQAALSALVLAAVSGICVKAARTRPALAFGWGWYLVTLAPVLGLVQVGAQARADRYTYLPLVGVSVMLAWGIGGVAVGRRRARLVPAAAAAAVCALAAAAFVQTGRWRESRTLYEHTLRVTSGNYVILYNAGVDALAGGRRREAAEDFTAALRINPRYAEACNNLGHLWFEAGRLGLAEQLFERASRLEPGNPLFRFNHGMALARQGKREPAEQILRWLRQTDPERARRLSLEIDAARGGVTPARTSGPAS